MLCSLFTCCAYCSHVVLTVNMLCLLFTCTYCCHMSQRVHWFRELISWRYYSIIRPGTNKLHIWHYCRYIFQRIRFLNIEVHFIWWIIRNIVNWLASLSTSTNFKLLVILDSSLPWDHMNAHVTTLTFKFVLTLIVKSCFTSHADSQVIFHCIISSVKGRILLLLVHDRFHPWNEMAMTWNDKHYNTINIY